MTRRKQPSQFRQLHLERLDRRDLPSATLSEPTLGDRVIVRYLDVPTSEPLAEALTPIGFGYHRLELREGVDAAYALRLLATRADVAEAMPDTLVTVERTTNDPLFPSQWSLTRTGTTAAWDSFTGSGRTVVAVIDTGVDYNHNDIRSNIWRNAGEIPGNGVDDDGNGFIDDILGYDFANNDAQPLDDEGHGTHVAGIIGATGNNALGISGVNMAATIMPLKFLRADGTGFTSDAVRALNYAVVNGARIVNLSWGGGSYNPALAAAIQQAQTAGVIVVAAAGNNGRNSDSTPFYPASYSAHVNNMVVVGASTSTDSAASYSNYGRSAVTLFAPGSSIVSLKPNQQYVTLSGTSMAAPFVSGALSLLWDRHPSWSYSQVITRLRSSVDLISSMSSLCQTGGRISVAKLLNPSSPPAPPAPPVTPPPAPPTGGTRTSFPTTAAPRTINDFTTVTMPITIASDLSITDVDVTINLTHSYVGDLSLRLIGPDGTSVLLANRRGGSGQNYASTLFSDQAATSITSAAAPFSGTLRPEGRLSAFDGRNARGTWLLSVSDHAYFDTGRLTAFTLHITGTTMTSQIVRKQAFVEAPRFAIIAPPVLRKETQALIGL